MPKKSLALYTRLMSLLVTAVLITASAFGYSLIEKVRVGSPIYADLIAGKDVIADVLPPPLYIIEAYLEASKAVLEPDTAPAREARTEQLKADYDARRAHWLDHPLTPDLQSALDAADQPAQAFFRIGFDRLYPALRSGDTAAAASAYADVSRIYADHRVAIDRVVALSSAWHAQTEAAAEGAIPFALTVIGVLAATVFGLVIATSVLAERVVVRPIGRVAAAMRDLAEGRTDLEVPVLGGTTEMREVTAAMSVFSGNARERAVLLAEVQEGRQAAEQRKLDLEQLAMNFLQDVDGMKTVLDREAHVVHGCAKAFGATVETSETEAGQGLASASAAADGVKAVATEAERLSASTQQIALRTREARQITEAAANRAKAAEGEVQALQAVAEKIKGILEAIGGIASQTNLLSLNATIEASRAGEAGRGFAVVAAEVKALAGETARATGEVDRMLQDINACTGAIVGSIGAIVGDVGAVKALNGDIAAAIGIQERATAEIAQSAEQAALNSEDARETNERLAEIVRQARGEVQRVGEASRSLFKVLGEFNAGTNRFLGTISQDMRERRSHIRHKVADPAEVIIGGRKVATTMQDLSLSGAAIAAVPGVAKGTAVTVVLGGTEIPAECMWVGDSNFGVRFRQVLSELPVALRRAV